MKPIPNTKISTFFKINQSERFFQNQIKSIFFIIIFGPIRKICNSELMRPLWGKLEYLEKLQVNENETKLLQNLFHPIVKHEKRAFLGPSFGDFWRHPQFYIQLVYRPHFGT